MDVSSLVEASDNGWAMIVGTVDRAGQPWAGRVWAVRAESEDVVRVAVDAHDSAVRECLAAGEGIAVTATDVGTLESVQLKGRSEGVERANRDDLAAVERNVEHLLAAIEGTDGLPRKIVSRFVPGDYVVCRVHCGELFDQTPGPDAGAKVAT